MRKKLAILSLLFFIGSLFPINTIKAKTGKFVVTAYYSPLPNQKYYMTGNFASEQRLQGRGIRGASGARVFSGMLAAPSKYSFGTKVYIEGLGVGNIQDRGGAIVPAGKRGYAYDRLDVWMGYGDEGLKRALAWGKRTVKGHVVSSNSPVTINYKNRSAPNWAVRNLKPQYRARTVYDYSLGVGSDANKVKKLQKLLQQTGLYTGKISGIYNSEMISIIADFQKQNNIIKSYTDEGTGYWGPTTRRLFKKMKANGTLKNFINRQKAVKQSKNISQKNVKQEVKKQEKLNTKNIKNKKIQKINKKTEKTEKTDIFTYYNKTKEEQKEVLKTLQKIGEYSGKLEREEKDFIDIIYNFQVKYKLVAEPSDVGAGYYGPKTRELLKKLVKQFDSVTQKAKKIQKIGYLELGETSDEVRELQEILIELGYFKQKSTANFGEVTKQALIQFQLDNKLIENKDKIYAGVFGPQTQKALEKQYKKYLLKK
ncbi:peptidoglycan-binding protein [Candidatus Gracilibacteria bacterium]|nr:peptidoglycan-binding protein [Candidatus Gracilibacteria bacterium]